MSEDRIERLAADLFRADRDAAPIGPLTKAHPALSIADAYAIQRRNRGRRTLAGDPVIGQKIGLTSLAMQEMLGVDQPDFGYLTESMLLDGTSISAAQFIAPRIEGEIAFRIGADLEGEGVTRAEVLAATEAVAPALEIIDSRIADWKIQIADTIADNASSGAVVVGEFQPLGDLDLAAVEMTLRVEGEGSEEVTGRGDAVLGHPADAIAWLARTLVPYGEGIEAGQIIIPGAMARALPVTAGSQMELRIDQIGDLRAAFETEDR